MITREKIKSCSQECIVLFASRTIQNVRRFFSGFISGCKGVYFLHSLNFSKTPWFWFPKNGFGINHGFGRDECTGVITHC